MTQKKTPEEYLEVIDEMIRLKEEEKYTNAMLAERFQMTERTVGRYLREHKINKEQQIIIDQKIWELRVRGRTQEYIAREVKLDQGTVSRILRRLAANMSEKLEDMRMEIKVTQIAMLYTLYSDLMDEWERSKKPKSKVMSMQATIQRKVEEAKEGGGDADPLPGRIEKTVEDRPGDLRIITEARAILADIREIAGIVPPQKISMTDPSGELPDATGRVVLLLPDNGRDDHSAAGG